jgi:hypothetical protein
MPATLSHILRVATLTKCRSILLSTIANVLRRNLPEPDAERRPLATFTRITPLAPTPPLA